MKLKYCDVAKKPEVIDNIILRCYCYEPISFEGHAQIDLGFAIEDTVPWVMVTGRREDDVLIYNVRLPNIWVFSPRLLEIGRGDFVCDLIISRIFNIRLEAD